MLNEERLQEIVLAHLGWPPDRECDCDVPGDCAVCSRVALSKLVAAGAFEEVAHFAESKMVKQYCKARAAELRGEGV